MALDGNHGDIETSRRPLLAALAAGGTAGLAGCSALSGGAPVGEAEAADRVIFDGLDHSALGDASLEVLDGDLVVSNVDGGGDDGVRVAFGEARRFRTEMSLDPENTPLGSYIESHYRGVLDGQTDQPTGNIRLTRVDGGYEADPDYSALGSRSYSVELQRDGEVVLSDGGFTEPVHVAVREVIPIVCFCAWHRWGWIWVWFTPVVTYTLPDGRTADADRVEFAPDSVDVEDGYATEVNVRAADRRSFRIENESVDAFGNFHEALGDVTLDPRDRGSTLVVGDVDGSGGDGVTVDFGGVTSAGVAFDPIGLPNDGMRFEVSGTGTVDGTSGQSIGWMGCRNNGGTVQAVADYSDVGSSDVRIEVVNDGDLVGRDVVDGGGVVATVSGAGDGAPRIHTCEKDIDVPDAPPCYLIGLDRDATITPDGGEELVGDRARFLADNPDATIDSIGSFDLTGTSLDSMTITDEA